MNFQSLLAPALFIATLSACEGEKASAATEAPRGASPAATAAAPTAAPAAAEVSCDTVVTNIASFNKGSGDSEKKLWAKMCADMAPKERACVAGAKSMSDMEKCMSNKPLK